MIRKYLTSSRALCVIFTASMLAHAAGVLADGNAGVDDHRPVYSTNFRGRAAELLIQAAQPADVAVAPDPVIPTRLAMRVKIRRDDDFSKVANGSPRSEFTLPRDFAMRPGQDYLIRWRTYLPNEFRFDHQQMEIITQIHQSVLSGPPPVMLTLTGEDYTISVRGGVNTVHGHGLNLCCARSDRGAWVDWALQYAPDASGRTAVTRIWKDGSMVYDGTGLPNAYPDDQAGYLKFGIYKPGWMHEASEVDALTLYFGEVSVISRKASPRQATR